MKPPLVAVTGGDGGLPVAWWFIAMALARAGACAVHITPSRPDPVQPVSGVIVSGGDDIDARLYLPDAPDVAPADPARDRFETAVIERVLETDLPLLGICRGAQLINVVLGGTLHADLRALRRLTSNRRTPLARKTLLIEDNTRLHDIVGRERARINSLHHQAIDRPGDGLQVSGRDLDSLIQAVEHVDRDFLHCVQWHPEYLPLRSEQRRLFAALCNAARRYDERADGVLLG